MKKKEKKPYVDDGHTIYDMDGVGRTGWWGSSKPTKEKKEQTPVGLTRRERWAAIRAALSIYLPVLLVLLAGFGLAAVLLSFWLRG